MKFLFLGFILFSSQVFGLDAVVTVLETPLLKYKSLDAPVVQYLRKGDVIKIDPSLNNDTSFDHLAPPPEKFTPPPTASLSDEFIATLDRQGSVVYVIRDHLYVYFTNEKEKDQTTLQKDPTDYRLDEPLPKKYPLYSPSGYRGQFLLGVTQPNTESYPYLAAVKTKGYMTPIDVNVTFLRQTPDDKHDRYYFGVTLNVRAYSNTFSLMNNVTAKEQGAKFGLGPLISFDAFKGQKNRVNLYGSINLYLFNQINISQSLAGVEEQRNYRALSFSPRIGVQYHRKQILEDVDFVLGTSMEMEPATTFRSSSAANQPGWWVNRGSDKFKTRTTFTLAGYVGFQAAY